MRHSKFNKMYPRFIAEDVFATLKSSRQNYLDVGASILLIRKYTFYRFTNEKTEKSRMELKKKKFLKDKH